MEKSLDGGRQLKPENLAVVLLTILAVVSGLYLLTTDLSVETTSEQVKNVVPGEKFYMNVSLNNTGNRKVKSFEVRLYSHGNNYVERRTVVAALNKTLPQATLLPIEVEESVKPGEEVIYPLEMHLRPEAGNRGQNQTVHLRVDVKRFYNKFLVFYLPFALFLASTSGVIFFVLLDVYLEGRDGPD